MPECTDNQCEWWALVEALIYIYKNGDRTEDFIIMTDSVLLHRQLKGEYRIKSKTLKPIYFVWNKYKNLLRDTCITYGHIVRENNPARRLLLDEN